MFSKIINDIFLKKVISNNFSDIEVLDNESKVTSVGVIIDETFFTNREDLKNEIARFDVLKENIKILVFKKKASKDKVDIEPFFTVKDFNISGSVKKEEVQQFLKTPFDLLINYYEVDRPPLLIVSRDSKAKFKVGFSSIDKRVNHLMINSTVNNYQEFIPELFKYLRILNKI